MASTSISNLWTPQIWIKGTDEVVRTFPSFLTSGAVSRNPLLDEIASGAGLSANIPFFKDLTDTSEAPQAELTAPSLNNHNSGTQVAAILNREVAYAAGALTAAVTGQDVVGDITRQLGMNRQKRIQTTAINILRGLFAFGSAPATAAALSGTRYDISSETGASPSADKLMSSSVFNTAAALLGELRDGLMQGGAILMHPNIEAALLNADSLNWTYVALSDQKYVLPKYKGIPVYRSNLLSRAGTTSGTVYDTYLIAPGAVGFGQKPQVGDQVDASSLQYYPRPDINDEQIYDRLRYLVHVRGTAFTGTPSGQSASNAELATSTNWALRFQTADRSGVVQIRTNG